VKHLAQRPEVQRTLRAELMSLLSGANLGVESNNGIPVLTYAAITSNQVPYLEAVVAESLRCAQVTPLTGRDTKEDTIILGHHIPKGQLITFVSAGSGNLNNRERAKAHPEFVIPPDSDLRSPTSRTTERKVGMWDKYTDRLEFAPERWLDHFKDGNGKETIVYNAKKGYNFQFGGGVRGCFGKPVAVRFHLFLSLAILMWIGVDPGTQTGSRDAQPRILLRSRSGGSGWIRSYRVVVYYARALFCEPQKVE
jgi:hypothetical protein